MLRIVNDFPKPGVSFLDMSPLLSDPKARRRLCDAMINALNTTPVDVVVGLESRGFIFGSLIAERRDVPFVMVRKAGKLPGTIHSVSYNLEYGSATSEIQADSIKPGQRVLVVDDILATGGTILAASQLIAKCGAKVSAICCLAEILELHGRQKIKDALGVDCLIIDQAPPELPDLAKPIVFKPYPNLHSPYPKSCEYVLLYHPSMRSLAEKLIKISNNTIQAAPVSFGNFPDSYPNITFPPDLINKRVIFLGSMYTHRNFLEQLSLMMILGRQKCLSVDIIIPYYGPATMERVEYPGIVATADTFAQIMSCCQSGNPNFSYFDIHASPTRFSFDSSKQDTWPLTAISLALERMELMCGKQGYVIAYPDEGSYKRFRAPVEAIRPNLPYIQFSKKRDGNKRWVDMTDKPDGLENFQHVLILDDLVQSGGTLYECYNALNQYGIRYVSAYVTHAVFPNRAYLDFLPGGSKSGFHKFWITDSNPQCSDILHNLKPFEVLTLAPLICIDLTRRAGIQLESPLRVAIASMNADKYKAAAYALKQCFPCRDHQIKQVQVDSGVAEQPISESQTAAGAVLRMTNMKAKCMPGFLEFDIWITIENGIETDRKTQEVRDFAIVNVVYSNKNIVRRSSSVTVPEEISKAFFERVKQEPTLTIGKVYAEKYPEVSASDWHSHACGESRAYILSRVLMDAFSLLR